MSSGRHLGDVAGDSAGGAPRHYSDVDARTGNVQVSEGIPDQAHARSCPDAHLTPATAALNRKLGKNPAPGC